MSLHSINRALDVLSQDVYRAAHDRPSGGGTPRAQLSTCIAGCKVVASYVAERRSGKPPLVFFCDNVELERNKLAHVLLRAENGVTYDIHINERQRNIIGGLLNKLRQERKLGDEDEAAILACLFDQLPSDETAHPGVLHGFCL